MPISPCDACIPCSARVADSDEGLGDGGGGRRCVLPDQRAHDLGDERRGRVALDAAPRADDAAQHPGNQDAVRDPRREGERRALHAGHC